MTQPVTTTPETAIAVNPSYRYSGIRVKRLNSFPAIGYGGRSTLKIAGGETFDALVVSSNMPLERLNMTVRLNNSPIYNNIPATFFKMLHEYKMLAPPASLQKAGENVFVIPFTDLSMKLRDGQERTSLVAMIGDQLELQVDIDGQEEDDPEVPSMAAVALTNLNLDGRIRQFLPRIERMNIELNAKGLNQYTGLVSDPKRAIRRMHFHTDKISNIEIRRDGVEAYELIRWTERYLAAECLRDWQNGWTHLDFVMRGYIVGEMFPTVRARELLFDITTTEAVGTVEVFMEYLDIERIPQQAVAV